MAEIRKTTSYEAPTIRVMVQDARRFSYPAQVARRERYLLLLATVFLLTGALVLGISLSLHETQNTPYAIRITLAVCSFIISFVTAHIFLNRYLPNRDPLLLPVAALLTGWSLLLIGRLAINFLLRQAIWLTISTAALLLIIRLSRDLRWLRRFRYTWLFGGLALLATTLVFGVNPSGYGLRLWLGLGGVYFQPVELLKLLMVVYLASYLAERRDLLVMEKWKIGRWQLPPLAYVGPLLAMLGIAIALLAWQQDLGAAMLFFFTFLAMLYLATGQWEYIIAGMCLFAIVGLAGYRLSDRVALRIDGWLNPWPDAADRAFQIVQSLLAFGAGGIFGQGLGLGNPTYIPAVHTDFVLAAIAEEFGLVGTLAVVALYGVLLLRGFRIALRSARPFERFLAAGLTSGLVIQAWVIMAGNAKVAPIAGVTLPFVSYGGSSLLISYIILGLLLRVSNHEFTVSTTRLMNQHTDLHLLALTRALLLALALLATTCGYWAFARAQTLRARDDNPRRVLYEQRIRRGRILDRNNKILADIEIAKDGTVTRRYPIHEAVPPVGYASLRYGTGGIEATFDSELRGEANRSTWQTVCDEMLHRSPRGHSLQLTLDAELQIQAQQALNNRAGAIVLLDATTGEILALASSPTFDPEHLDERWEALSEDPNAPLLNRATQGLYQPGTAMQTIILAEGLSQGLVDLAAPALNGTAAIPINGTPLECSRIPSAAHALTLADAYAAACPVPFSDLGERLGSIGLQEMVERWKLTTPPALEIPAEATEWDASILSPENSRMEAIGQGSLTASPLQMALVAATLANGGEMPAPRLTLRIQEAEGSWREHPAAGERQPILRPEVAKTLLDIWPVYGIDVKGHGGIAIAGQGQQPHRWFLGIAPADTPRYAVAVLIERTTVHQQAIEVGTTLLQAVSR